MDSNHWEEFPLNHLITQEEDPRAITQIIITYFRNNNIDINTKFGGYNCLHYAASTANGLLMRNLEIYFLAEIDFNATTTPGNETALHLVIQQNDPSTLREFLRANIDPNIRRKVDGRTALHLAVLEEDNDILTYLLQHYIHIEIDAKDYEGATALHYAIQKDNWYKAKQLLDHHADQNVARNDGKTPLHIAAQNKSTAILRKLIYTCISPQLNAVDEDQMTPLYLSVIAEHLRAVEILLMDGADPDWKPSNRESIIEFAVNHSHPIIFAALLKKSKMIDSEEISSIVFQAAIANDDEEKVTILLENGVNPNIKWKRENIYVTPLVDVIEKNKPTMVGILLKYGADVNTVDGYGNTPLHIACQQNQKDIVEILLKSEKVDVNVIDGTGKTPLDIAVCINNNEINDNKSIVDILLNAGADPNIPDPITGEILLHKAVLKGNLMLVKFLLDIPSVNINARTKDEETALHLAVRDGDESITLALLEKGADPIIIAKNCTPLYIAVMESNTDLVKLLLQYKYQEDKAVSIQQSSTALPIIKRAVKSGNSEIVNLLLEAYQKFHKKQKKRKMNILQSCLQIAVNNGHLETVRVLLEHGAKPFYRVKEGHDTPLFRNLDILKLLIEYGADVNATDNSNWAPLHCAVCTRNVEFVTFLLDHGADPNIEFKKYKIAPIHLTVGDYRFNPRETDCLEEEDEQILKILLEDERTNVNVKDIHSFTPFDFAVAKNRPDVVELLLKHKADPLAGLNPDGKGLLHFAIKHRNINILKEILNLENIPSINLPYNYVAPPLLFAIQIDDLESIRLLLQYKADVNLKYESSTVLGTAIRKQNEEVIKLVLKVPGLNVNEPSDCEGFTPLHLAVVYRYKWLVLQLLELGADLNATTIDGNSILHIAVFNIFLEYITILVRKHNIAVDVRNNEGLTPLLMCCLINDNHLKQSIISILLDLGADPSARSNAGNSIIHYLAITDSIDSIWPINSSFAELIHAENLTGNTPLHFACNELAHKSVMLLLNAGASMTVTNSEDETPIYCYLSSFMESESLNLTTTIVGHSTKKIMKKIMEKMAEEQNTAAVLNIMKFDKVEHWFSVNFLSCLMNYAIKRGNVEMVETFLNSGADVNFKREVVFDEHINLFLALRNREIFKLLLLDKNCDVNLRGKDSKTVLHYAVRRNLHLEAYLLLLNGANPNCRDNAGLIPYHYASNAKMEELLLLYGADPFYIRGNRGIASLQNHKQYLISRAVMREILLNDNTEINRFRSFSGSQFMNNCRANIQRCFLRIDFTEIPELDESITYKDIVVQDYTKIHEGNIMAIKTIINSDEADIDMPLYIKYIRTQMNVMKHSLPIMKPIGRIGMTLRAFLEADEIQRIRYLDNPEVRQFFNDTNLLLYTRRYSYELYQAIELCNNTISLRNSTSIKLIQSSGSLFTLLPIEILEMILKFLDRSSLMELNKAFW